MAASLVLLSAVLVGIPAIAGKQWNTWAVEERAIRGAGVTLIGTWYLADVPPYMVYAETVGPNGAKQRMTEVLSPAQ